MFFTVSDGGNTIVVCKNMFYKGSDDDGKTSTSFNTTYLNRAIEMIIIFSFLAILRLKSNPPLLKLQILN